MKSRKDLSELIPHYSGDTMSADCFSWHPDQNDVYDGSKCGSMTLRGSPSQFTKTHAYGFTMTGAPEDTLTLEAIAVPGDDSTWWVQGDSTSSVAHFNIASGTFKYKLLTTASAFLYISNPGGNVPAIVFTVSGRCILEAPMVAGDDSGLSYAYTEIDIQGTGFFSVLANSFSNQFTVKVGGMGAMQIHASSIYLVDSSYAIDSVPPNGEYSLDLAPSAPAPAESQSITLNRTTILCQSQSKTRLRSRSIELDSSVIRASDNAQVEFACDLFSFTGGTRFTLSGGSGAFRFSSANGENGLSIDTIKIPAGTFNFITNEGENGGVFWLRATSPADARKQWLLALAQGWFAIDGTTTNGQVVNGYKVDGTVFDGTYMKVSLEKTK